MGEQYVHLHVGVLVKSVIARQLAAATADGPTLITCKTSSSGHLFESFWLLCCPNGPTLAMRQLSLANISIHLVSYGQSSYLVL
jgi:hypothetical protein